MGKPIDLDTAIDAVLKESNADGAYGYMDTKSIIDLLNNLLSAQQDSCEYCHEDSNGYVKPVEKNCHAFIRFGMDGWELSLKANGWHGSAKIMYCPMCGRKLKNDK